MEKIDQKLIEIVAKNPDTYSDFYVNNEKDISAYVQSIEGVKTDNYLYNFTTDLDKLRFSVVFSDFSNVFSRFTAATGQMILLKEQKVTVNDEIINAVLHQGETPILHPGYFISGKDETTALLKQIEPLIVTNRALLHNQRIVLGLTGEKGPNDKGRVWKSFSIDPNSPSGNWLAMENAINKDSIQINFNPSDEINKTELFEITVPYLKGISFKDLSLILNDNQDLLSAFRINLKKLVEESKANGKSVLEMKNDMVRPAVDKVSNEFKKIKNIHKLKIAGTTMITVTLGLLSLSNMGLGQVVSGFLGTSGLGLLVKQEIDFQKKLASLKDNPFYLMWELKNKK